MATLGFLAHTIVLCDDIKKMDAFYARIFSRVPGAAAPNSRFVVSFGKCVVHFMLVSPNKLVGVILIAGVLPFSYELESGKTMLRLRERTRGYDGQKGVNTAPGVQLTFLVPDRDAVLRCYAQLLQLKIPILEPPTDQPRGHCTVYFADPEGNQLEIWAEIPAFEGEPRPVLAAAAL